MLLKASTNRELLETIKKQKLAYFGHIMREKDPCLEKGIIEGTLPRSKRKVLRRKVLRTAWNDNVKD